MIVVPLVSDLVGNPKDRFFHVAAHLILRRFQVNIININGCYLIKFPTLPVIFSIYLKIDFLDFFEIL